MISLDSRPCPNPSIVGRLVEDGAILILPERGEVKVLNEVATHIWQLADGSRTIEEIIRQICRKYEVSPSVAMADTLAFVSVLVELGILDLSAEERR